MTPFDPDLLRSVRTLDDVLEFLGEQLDWPTREVELDDASFEFSSDELGVPSEDIPALKSIRQLRPLTTGQPWGIFFLEFEGPKLPVTPLRRLLRAVVRKKRATSDARRSWHLDDLLFVTATDSGDSVELHLVAFFDTGGPQPEIRSLPWNPDHSPRQHLTRLAWELLPRLEWPDDPDEAESWRSAWRNAFALRHGAALSSAAQLADRMAQTAHDLRDRVAGALAAEDGEGPFTDLLKEIGEELVSGIDADRFADMCAQTLVYGALTARVIDPTEFGASPVLTTVPLANPFLTSFFEQVHDQVTALDLDAAGLEALVADLRETQVEAILDQFGATSAGGDPVIHFYERFLQAYDTGIRAEVGAFYTPQAVVESIVRLVDDALRTRVGLEEGIADAATWAEVASRSGFQVPHGVDPASRFVSVLDPATGTGTFLVEWVRGAQRAFEASGAPGDWSTRLRDVVLPNMHAFELLLAPYAIAHLKLALEVGPELAESLASNIFLTDALELPGPVAQLEGLDPVAREGQRAAVVKRDSTPTVIIGNPPYRRVRRDETGGWVANVSGDRPALMQDVIDVATQSTIFSHVASLYNLYTYFWRWSIWKTLERAPEPPGVVAFITASSWLDGPGFIGLREAARSLCTEVWIVDLAGDNRGTQQDENVFAIETPVAIVVLVRAGATDHSEPAAVRYRRIEGTRTEKLAALATVAAPTDGDDTWLSVPSETGLALRPLVGDETWTSMPALADIFPWQCPGTKFNRTWPIAPTAGLLRERWDAFLVDESSERRAELLPTPASGRNVTTKVGKLPTLASLPSGAPAPPVSRYQWRPFDRQWAFQDPRITALERPALWQSRSKRQLILATLASEPIGSGPALLAFTSVPDLHVFRGSFGGKDIIPLYRDSAATAPNVLAGLVELLAARLGGATISEETIAAYVMALLSTPGYQARFETFLQDKVVRVPLTSDPSLWNEAVRLGGEVIWLHTLGERSFAGFEAPVPRDVGVAWETTPTRIPVDASDLEYDVDELTLRVADGQITGVHSGVWDYEVSGWPVLPRWLEHRTARGRGRRSSELDALRPTTWDPGWSDELVQLITVLTRAIELQPEQDDLLDKICAGPLIPATDLPTVTDAQRTVPTTQRDGGNAAQLPLA